MFEGPEYESYIALCRELRLDREWQDGDSYGFAHPGHEPIGVEMCGILQPYRDPPSSWPDSSMENWWLPRLDQWLSKLREAGEDGVTLVYDNAWGYSAQIVRLSPIWCPSYEESCARLWMAVTGRESIRTGSSRA